MWNQNSALLRKNLFETVRFPPCFTKDSNGSKKLLVIFGIKYITLYSLEKQKRVRVIKYPQGVCLSEYQWLKLSQN
jgi:hypothetical protein